MRKALQALLRLFNVPEVAVGDMVCLYGVIGEVIEIVDDKQVLIRLYDGAKMLVHKDFILEIIAK